MVQYTWLDFESTVGPRDIQPYLDATFLPPRLCFDDDVDNGSSSGQNLQYPEHHRVSDIDNGTLRSTQLYTDDTRIGGLVEPHSYGRPDVATASRDPHLPTFPDDVDFLTTFPSFMTFPPFNFNDSREFLVDEDTPGSQHPEPTTGHQNDIAGVESGTPVAKRVVGSPAIEKAAAKRRAREAKHHCNICGRSFTEPRNLKFVRYHIDAHEGVKGFQCQMQGVH
ncbi:hypothetical protein ONZ45_g17653 [Pleurotus djamor]|nr:hypothetical protein ONZ45_g17653 [Pleurotus djamor]